MGFIKAIAYLGICFLSTSASGYVIETHQDPPINYINLYRHAIPMNQVNPHQEVSLFSLHRENPFEMLWERIHSMGAKLQNEIGYLNRQIQFLISKLPKCPSTAPSGMVIGIYCYDVTTTLQSFANAQADCQSRGGTLAEPVANSVGSAALYGSLKAKFPLKFTTIESATTNPGMIWIGLIQDVIGASPLYYQSNQVAVQNDNPIFSPSVNTASVVFAAVFVRPGNSWTALDPSTTLPYVCQFNVV